MGDYIRAQSSRDCVARHKISHEPRAESTSSSCGRACLCVGRFGGSSCNISAKGMYDVSMDLGMRRLGRCNAERGYHEAQRNPASNCLDVVLEPETVLVVASKILTTRTSCFPSRNQHLDSNTAILQPTVLAQ
jgi:hypothetical protein